MVYNKLFAIMASEIPERHPTHYTLQGARQRARDNVGTSSGVRTTQ